MFYEQLLFPLRLKKLKSRTVYFNVLTLIREFLGSSPSAFSGKKSRTTAGGVTVGSKKIKYVQIECQLGDTMVQISNGICQYQRKYAVLKKIYAVFCGPWPSVISGKNIQSTKTNDATLRSRING